MNQNIQTSLKTFRPLVAAALLCASFGSQAADSMSTRAASGVGSWIAAQGNAALRELGQDLRKQLRDSIKPLLPQPESPPESQPADASQPDLTVAAN
ncbi:hypothetical protein [Hydrocarboniphaga sp.]|uniref:hypothetical protein n=1 Tax=Hydrocarboniphaga sp. TaxID=2033016 RepID=UPI003D1205B4